MAHVRTQLRTAVKAALVADGVVSTRVFASRSHSRDAEQLPYIEVSTPSEQNEGSTMDGTVERDVSLTVSIFEADSGDVETALDAIAVSVEEALYGNAAISAISTDISPVSMEFELGVTGDRNVGRLQVEFLAKLATEEGMPETAL